MEEYHREFEDISKLIKSELDRFDHEKVEDFRDSVEQFLCSMIEHQKQASHFFPFIDQISDGKIPT